ncbi:MAG TPA: LptF/LptG family permease [Thermoguttaceae bacterium]|nr:LptF/LptG family permease [Thermoguttaceae bacterium]
MKILTRYILAELLKWFLVSLGVLTLTILIFFVAREAIHRGLPPVAVLRLIPCFLPTALWIALPGTLLLATTSVYGRLAGSNEVLAIKAQGISPRRILEPIWVLAFMASLVTVLLNDVAVSWGRNQVRHVLVESVEEIAYRMLMTNRTYSAGQLAINVKAVVGRKLIRPTVSRRANGSVPSITVTASEAELRKTVDQGEAVLKIEFGRCEADFGTAGSAEFPSYTFIIPLEEASQTGESGNVASNLPLRMIPAETARQRTWIAQFKKNLAARAAFQMLRGDLDALQSDEWDTQARVLRDAHERLYRLWAEPHRRWSSGFSCLFFAWVGAPMAIRLRNRDMLTSFFLCFLPILIVYYPLLVFGIDGAKDGRLPCWSVWMGNLLLGAWGYVLLRKVIRY